jgi:hypothetical protein
MITAERIQEQLASYVANGIDLDSLEDWIAQHTWNLHQSHDLAAIRLGYAAELLLSEHSNGDGSEVALKNELSLLLLTPMAKYDHVLLGESRSSNRLLPAPVWQPWQRVDTRDAVQYA